MAGLNNIKFGQSSSQQSLMEQLYKFLETTPLPFQVEEGDRRNVSEEYDYPEYKGVGTAPVVIRKKRKKLPKDDCDPAKFKTAMCNHWLKRGKCPFRDKCAFAHGKEELSVGKQRAKTLNDTSTSLFLHLARQSGSAVASISETLQEAIEKRESEGLQSQSDEYPLFDEDQERALLRLLSERMGIKETYDVVDSRPNVQARNDHRIPKSTEYIQAPMPHPPPHIPISHVTTMAHPPLVHQTVAHPSDRGSTNLERALQALTAPEALELLLSVVDIRDFDFRDVTVGQLLESFRG